MTYTEGFLGKVCGDYFDCLTPTESAILHYSESLMEDSNAVQRD